MTHQTNASGGTTRNWYDALGRKTAERNAEGILSQWDYDAERSLDLGRQDRSAIYGGFHIYRKKP